MVVSFPLFFMNMKNKKEKKHTPQAQAPGSLVGLSVLCPQTWATGFCVGIELGSKS